MDFELVGADFGCREAGANRFLEFGVVRGKPVSGPARRGGLLCRRSRFRGGVRLAESCQSGGKSKAIIEMFKLCTPYLLANVGDYLRRNAG